MVFKGVRGVVLAKNLDGKREIIFPPQYHIVM